MKAISLFSGIGIDEFYLKENGIDIILANEIIKSRAEAYKQLHENQNIICDDICKDEVKKAISNFAIENNIDIILATPPCQGLSWAGANKNIKALLADKRNFLVLNAVEIIEKVLPNYVLIENVPRFAEMLFPFNDELITLEKLLNNKFSDKYKIDVTIYDAADFGVPQYRQRIVYRMWKKNLTWANPKKSAHITLQEAIGDLPSLEAGEKSDIPNHFARVHPANHIECMKHTPTGKSAYDSKICKFN